MTQIGRNESCPCGSKKKFKRCCGVNAPPKLGEPKWPSPEGMSPGVDPNLASSLSNPMDPELMAQLNQAIQSLPKDQIKKLQKLMKKAMSGADVSSESEALEKELPQEFQTLLSSITPPEQELIQKDPKNDATKNDSKIKKLWRSVTGKPS